MKRTKTWDAFLEVEESTTWDGMAGLLNTILVVNTLLATIQISLLALVKPESELSAWQRGYTKQFWHTFAFGCTLGAMSSVYSTAVLAVLSFISDSN